MSRFRVDHKGFKELRAAVRRNPRKTVQEVGKFLARGIAVYNRQIIRDPWRLGQTGGGAPVDTGNLRDTHRREVRDWSARIYPTAPYAMDVHEGTSFMKARPWLDYAMDRGKREIDQLEQTMLNNIVADLAR